MYPFGLWHTTVYPFGLWYTQSVCSEISIYLALFDKNQQTTVNYMTKHDNLCSYEVFLKKKDFKYIFKPFEWISYLWFLAIFKDFCIRMEFSQFSQCRNENFSINYKNLGYLLSVKTNISVKYYFHKPVLVQKLKYTQSVSKAKWVKDYLSSSFLPWRAPFINHIYHR